jgi:hypothetical protein
MVVEGPVRFELTTRGLKGRCSNRLSYGPGYPQGGRAGPLRSGVPIMARFFPVIGKLTPYIIRIFVEKSIC